MTIQTINIGNAVNDGLGDDLRSAFQKVNANFSALAQEITVTASNVGTTGYGIFKEKVDSNLEFKNLVPGTKILIEENPNTLIINSTQSDAFTRIDTDLGNIVASSAGHTTNITIQGGDNIRTAASGSVVTVDTILDLNQILLNLDFGPIGGTFINPTQLALAAANIDFGTIENPGWLNIDLGDLGTP